MWTHPLGFLFLYNSFGVSCGRHEVTISRETLASTAILNLQGTGATFPLDIYTNANFAYRFTAEDILVRYQGIGSSGGKVVSVLSVSHVFFSQNPQSTLHSATFKVTGLRLTHRHHTEITQA